ncbi:MAG: oligosaccharide flippase family protein [Betaproteobacteria bacterium]
MSLLLSKIGRTFSLLALANFSIILIPIAYYPFVIQAIGGENFGAIVYYQAITLLLGSFVEYGFDIVGTKKLSIAKSHMEPLSFARYRDVIFTSIVKAKAILFIIAILLYLIFLLTTEPLLQYNLVYLFPLLLLEPFIGSLWYFQAIDQVSKVVLSVLVSRILVLPFILIAVSGPEDTQIFILCLLVSSVMASCISCFFVFKSGFRWKTVSLSSSLADLREGFGFFISRSSVVILNKLNAVFLGIYSGGLSLAYYDLAEKLVNLCLLPFNIFNQAIFPIVAHSKDVKLTKIVLMIAFPLAIIAYVGIYGLFDYVIIFYAGLEMAPAKNIFFILGLLIPLSTLNYFLGNTYLVILEKNYLFNLSSVLALICYIGLVSIFAIISLLDVAAITLIFVASTGVTLLVRIWAIWRT